MLTKQDLEAIGKIIDPVKTAIKELGEKIGDLEEKVDDKTSELYTSIFSLKVENAEDHRGIKRRISEFRKEFNEFVRHFDRSLQETRREIDRIKGYIKIPSL